MAGNLQSVGFASLCFEPLEVHAGPKGCTTTFRVTCPTIAPLIAYYNLLNNGGAQIKIAGCDVGLDGETTAAEKFLEVEFPGIPSTLVGILTEVFADQWELVTNEGTDTIFNNPLIVGGSSPVLNANDKDVLIQLAINGGTLPSAVSAADTNVPADMPHTLPTSGAALQLALEIFKGQTEYETPTYVLRHTSYCSAGANYNTSIAQTQHLYTTAQLLTEVGSGWTIPLPNRLYSKISAIPIQYAAADEATYYTWSWLKKIGRENLLANYMVEVSTEYELALWSNLRYAPHI